MLSVAQIGGGGAKYYEADGYYAKDDPEHRAASSWHGKGAQTQGLNGPVETSDLDRVLQGILPDGRQLGRPDGEGGIIHRTGQDLTFSAPKSVSLAALLGGDGRILQAHDEAVKATLDRVESTLQTRLRVNGEMQHQENQSMVAATFRHDTSRNLDPQLHTHALVANMVQSIDDKWRTVDFRSIYQNKMFLGALYRNELAGRLREMGYEIEKTHSDGRFEIVGIDREVIEAFSTRRADILSNLEAHGLKEASASDKALAALLTRNEKKEPERAELKALWTQRAQEIGFDPQKTVQEAIQHRDRQQDQGNRASQMSGAKPSLEAARAAVDYAVSHLSERESVFGLNALVTQALSRNPGTVTLNALETVLGERLKDGSLYAAPVAGKHMLTTKHALLREAESIALAVGPKGKQIASQRTINRALSNGSLTRGQAAAATLILTAKDRVVGVQGYAGTGKTTMLRRTRELAEQQGYRLMGLAPSASAAHTLQQESGIPSQTLQKFLAQYDGVAHDRLTRQGRRDLRADFKKTLLVVDEGSLAASRSMRDLLTIAKEVKLPKLVLVGDKKQLGAVEAGKPFEQLQQAGMKTAIMDEIMRQRDPQLREAVKDSIADDKGHIARAFDKMGANINEVGRRDLALAVTTRFLAERNEGSVGLIAPSHALRREINALVRENLIHEGKITGPEITTQRLVSKDMTEAEKRLFRNYSRGDTVIFNKSYKRLGVEKGQVWHVKDRHATGVYLEREGRSADWQPHRIGGGRKGAVEVYRSEDIGLRAGDWIRFTRNDEGLGLANGSTGVIENIGGDKLSLKLDDGRSLEMNKTAPALRHIDYAWAATAHAFQGKTVDRMIGVMESQHPHLTTQRSFYVQISRARDQASLFTDDANRLKTHLEHTTGDRIAALEGIGRDVTAKPDKTGSPEPKPETPERTSPSQPSMPPPKQTELDFGRDLGR